MSKFLKVLLWGKEVGKLVWDEQRKASYFTYDPDFVKTGLNIAPLVAPIDNPGVLEPIWGNNDRLYQQLPEFLADSLPDAWGNILFEMWRWRNHIPSAQITPLDKLAFLGRQTIGALEYLPEQTPEFRVDKFNIKALADLADRISQERGHVRITLAKEITMQTLLAIGSSVGGRWPKALIAIHPETGEIRGGQQVGMPDFDYYLLKFGCDMFCRAELEMTYYELACSAGITMMPSKLYTVDGHHHFLTKRFDRVSEEKLHTQTLAAIDPDADSYEQLLAVCRKLALPESDCQEVFRRMVFNILSNNTDDHHKNYSFVMQRDGSWRLSPAYDLNYIYDICYFDPDEYHSLSIRARRSHITRKDVTEFARDNGIQNPDAVIQDVVAALKQFRAVALKNEVSDGWIENVEQTIMNHLKEWNEFED